EASEIDAKHWSRQAGAANAIRHAEQRPIPAQNQDEPDLTDECLLVGDASAPIAGHQRGGRGFEDDFDAAFAEPLLDVHQVGRRVLKPRLRDDAYARDGWHM